MSDSDKIKEAIDYARSMVGKTPSDKDLRDYLRGTIDPRKYAWCTAFLNASLRKAGIKGTPSMMASSFLNWGRHVEPKDVRAGDIVVLGESKEERGIPGPPVPGGHGHAALVTGAPFTNEKGWRYTPTISGDWTHRVQETAIPTDEGTAEYRRALPSHEAREQIMRRGGHQPRPSSGHSADRGGDLGKIYEPELLHNISDTAPAKESNADHAPKQLARMALLKGRHIEHPEKGAFNEPFFYHGRIHHPDSFEDEQTGEDAAVNSPDLGRHSVQPFDIKPDAIDPNLEHRALPQASKRRPGEQYYENYMERPLRQPIVWHMDGRPISKHRI